MRKRVKLDNSDPLCTVEQAAEFLSLARSTVYQLIDLGTIASVDLAGSGARRIRRIRKSALLAYLAAGE